MAKEEKKDGSNIGGHLMDLAKDGSEDRTSTPAEDKAGIIMPGPTQKDAGMIVPAPTEKEACTTPPVSTETEAGPTPPAPTGIEASKTPEMPTDPNQMGTPKSNWAATPSSENSSSDDDIEDVA